MTRISVCMATYNGRAYVEAQIASILAQLAPDDELIVCDDGSADGTCELVEAFGDPRIRLFRNAVRLGYARNFERALELATGEIVFLSDQDDIWRPDKVAAVCDAFLANPEAAMVHHERSLIDSTGTPIGEGPRLGAGPRRGAGFLAREFVRARLWGCCMALRARTVRRMLPFPRSVYGHDHWAMIVAAFAGGIVLLPLPLILHRRHVANVTPKRGLPLAGKLSVRLQFIAMAVIAWWRTRRGGDRDSDRNSARNSNRNGSNRNVDRG